VIAITTIGGVLRVVVETEIPSAAGGQWSEARIARLIETISETVEAAELVDAAAMEIKEHQARKNRAA
jgi:hypothetical protein